MDKSAGQLRSCTSDYITFDGPKERPILFSSEMVRAILDGRKTQTRRVMKPQPVNIAAGGPDCWWLDHGKANGSDYKGDWLRWCPYGQVGDRLWVRETWRPALTENGHECYGYFATLTYRCGKDMPEDARTALRWRPSIFMPRLASRITLEVTDVRVQRLQAMSYDDCWAEGVDTDMADVGNKFARLWDSINAKRGYPWESNPWVWCISFAVC